MEKIPQTRILSPEKNCFFNFKSISNNRNKISIFRQLTFDENRFNVRLTGPLIYQPVILTL